MNDEFQPSSLPWDVNRIISNMVIRDRNYENKWRVYYCNPTISYEVTFVACNVADYPCSVADHTYRHFSFVEQHAGAANGTVANGTSTNGTYTDLVSYTIMANNVYGAVREHSNSILGGEVQNPTRHRSGGITNPLYEPEIRRFYNISSQYLTFTCVGTLKPTCRGTFLSSALLIFILCLYICKRMLKQTSNMKASFFFKPFVLYISIVALLSVFYFYNYLNHVFCEPFESQIDGYISNHGITSPLDQFEIRDLFNINAPVIGNSHISLTNIGLYLTIAAFLILTLNLLATNYNKVMSNNWSLSQESVYATIHGIVINQINAVKGQIYFPLIYSLFIFILINNLMGMVPYSFASTSHFVLTFFISFTVVLGATILGFQLHQLIFFSLLVPSGCPLGLLPLLVLIEFISYLARNVSLGLRLAANILSGHMLLNILSGFAYNIMNSGFVYLLLGLVPLAFIMAFSALELGISFIQAQVFVVLSSSYIKDGLDLH